MRRPFWIPWRWWRRATQLVLLIVFLWLFRCTEFHGSDQLAGGESILFRLDPLAAAAAMLGGRQIIWLFWPALLMVGLTLVFGRFFCGWVCPLGTLLDYFHILSGPLSRKRERARVRAVGNARNATGESQATNEPGAAVEPRAAVEPGAAVEAALTPGPSPACGRGEMRGRASYFLLATVLVAAVFAYPLVGFVDPFSLLVRAMTFWGDPAFYRTVDASFSTADEGWAVEVLQPFIKEHFLPFRAMAFHLAGVSAAILAVLFVLEFVARRFWCRYLCPAGAMFGLFSHRSLVKRRPVKVCKGCGTCVTVCRMGAFDVAGRIVPPDCTLCMDCVDACPKSIVKFSAKRRQASAAKPTSPPLSAGLSRRGMLAGIAAGVAIPGVARLGGQRPLPVDLLRPPGVDSEKDFLSLCVRCGECMKVCPTNVLQPAVFEAGLEGVFSPRVVPRFVFEQSFCEFACTLCGQVCPSGAIPRLTEALKHERPTGKAYFDHARCLPWAESTPCIRCEEMCPVSDKAIKILKTLTVKDKDGNDVELQLPYVDRDLCVGCGICESNCTIDGNPAAIRVFRVDAPDPGTETLLNQESPGKEH